MRNCAAIYATNRPLYGESPRVALYAFPKGADALAAGRPLPGVPCVGGVDANVVPIAMKGLNAMTQATTTPADGYAGDVTPQQAWQWVQAGQAVLVDVRTDAEREWVGRVPGAAPVAWKQWPGMAMNADFDAQLRAAVPAGTPVVLLCRSGVRSVAAARRATELGLTAYNILEGFEGDLDGQAHRGGTSGWRLRGLPWQQG